MQFAYDHRLPTINNQLLNSNIPNHYFKTSSIGTYFAALTYREFTTREKDLAQGNSPYRCGNCALASVTGWAMLIFMTARVASVFSDTPIMPHTNHATLVARGGGGGFPLCESNLYISIIVQMASEVLVFSVYWWLNPFSL